MRRSVTVGVVVWTVVGWPIAVRAADSCIEGLRPATAGEKAFHVQTLARVRAALPVLAAGWRVVDETDVRAPQFACIGQERRPLAFEYSLRAEPTADATGSVAGRPSSPDAASLGSLVRITVKVNPREQPIDERAEPFDAPLAVLAFRARAENTPTGSVRLLFGDWSWDPEDPAEAPGRARAHAYFEPGVPHTRVQALVVEIDGPRVQVDALLARLDLPALASLVTPSQ